MKKIIPFLILLLLFILPINGTTEWDDSVVTGGQLYWHAEKSELRDLDNNEVYTDNNLVGGANVPDGETYITIDENPSNTFDLINGDRIEFTIVIEGDMIFIVDDYNSDYHLLVLPIGIEFFELLFNEVNLLENLTSSTFVSKDITNGIATLVMIYNQTNNVTYKWNIETGILSEKMVLAPSGLSLHIVEGKNNFLTIPVLHVFVSLIHLIFIL
ncbi:MAG: hypothetical protein OEZ01_04060, partial [Candidatus Heimdallarchaeota archaeon]|nr:hypothetical protein [Candidatus Heimdallarchaeota archaeon]